VKIEVREQSIKCYLDSVKVYECNHEKTTGGVVGFGTWDTVARFRDILVVSRPGGKILWKGLPQPPPIKEH
jgi:hypothetical protein